MSVLGIDLSTFKVHVVALDDVGDGAHLYEFDLGKGDLLERIRRVHYVLPARDRWDDNEAIAIERPAGGAGAWQVSMAFGAVLQCLPYGVLVHWYWPGEWRKLALGDGRGQAKKPEVLAWVLERWPECPGQDAADAYCVARACRSQVVPA